MRPKDIAHNIIVAPELEAQLNLAVEGLDRFPQFVNLVTNYKIRDLGFSESVPEHAKDSLPLNNVPGVITVWGGIYSNHKELYINPAAKQLWVNFNTFGPKPLGKAEVIAATVPYTDVDTALLVHELSHHIDFYMVRDSQHLIDYVFKQTGFQAHDAGLHVSSYASTTPEEWFAETMSAYLYKPDELYDFDRASYQAMKTVLDVCQPKALKVAA